MSKLALLGGEPLIKDVPEKELFGWPIYTQEDEDALLYVARNNLYSLTDITKQFEAEFAAWMGTKHALAFCNGTMAVTAAMFAAGIGVGDEVICTTKTYWASITQCMTFGATPVFCNIDEHLSMDPDDLERCITPKTKAIIVVHYLGYPADMDRIMPIAKKHNLIVIEDVSHAQGGLYKGKKVGTFGDIAAMSLMSGKSFAAGELGIIVTDKREYFERAIAFGHYDRNNAGDVFETEYLKPYYGISLTGSKGRANQLCSALARVQLKYYDERTATIRQAMNYFYDLLGEIDGLTPLRVDESTGSTMGGFYCPHVLYDPSKFGGLSAKKFAEAMRAEGVEKCWDGANYCLHTHRLFNDFNLFHTEKPSRIAYTDRDVRVDDKLCDPSVQKEALMIPWFKHFGEFDKEWIKKYVAAFRKVAENYRDLLESDEKSVGGRWSGTSNS